MPYKRTGTAIAHYLKILSELAERYGNPFVPAYLPEPVELGEKKYSRETILRYISWIKKYYRDKNRTSPITIDYMKDRIRGKVLRVYVDRKAVEEETKKLTTDETPWPYRNRSTRDKEIQRLKDKIRKLEQKITKCREKLEEYRELEKKLRDTINRQRDQAETIKNLRYELHRITRKYRTLICVIKNIVYMKPEQVIDCVDKKNNTIECDIVRLLLDRAITYVNDVTAFDIVMTEISDEYLNDIRKISIELEKFVKSYEKILDKKHVEVTAQA